MPKPIKFYALQLKREGKWMNIPYPAIPSLAEARVRAAHILADKFDDVEDIRIHTFTQTNTSGVGVKS